MRGKVFWFAFFVFHITYFFVRFFGTESVRAFLFLALISNGFMIGLMGLESDKSVSGKKVLLCDTAVMKTSSSEKALGSSQASRASTISSAMRADLIGCVISVRGGSESILIGARASAVIGCILPFEFVNLVTAPRDHFSGLAPYDRYSRKFGHFLPLWVSIGEVEHFLIRDFALSMTSTSSKGSSPASISFSNLMASWKSSTVEPVGLIRFSFMRQCSNSSGDWQFLCSEILILTISAFFGALISRVFL